MSGPCKKLLNRQFLSSLGKISGPGGQEFFTDLDGAIWMAYAAWTFPNTTYPAGKRSFRIDRVTF